MSNPWNINKLEIEPNFSDIMSEEYALRLHKKDVEKKKLQEKQKIKATKSQLDKDILQNVEPKDAEDYSVLANDAPNSDKILPSSQSCESDAIIAKMLQSQFDQEYNEELNRLEKQRNKNSKVTITFDKYRPNIVTEFCKEQLENDSDGASEENDDWYDFDSDDKLYDKKLKSACKLEKGEKKCNSSGDGACYTKLPNQIHNQLKNCARRSESKKNKMQDRKVSIATAEMGVDEPTRLILYKLITNHVLEQINGIISTGKEAVILHANSDTAFIGKKIENQNQNNIKEFALKIFKTTLNEFKQRGRYIKDDYRFKKRFSTQNNRVIINMWAEKEMHNLKRMKMIGINCPEVVILKKHVLIMQFIGENQKAAPKLKDVKLNDNELVCAYEEIIAAIYKLYNEAHLVHADLSEYNILWYESKCFFIDVAQAVEPKHPSALEFLMRDCGNIINFFSKRGLSDIYTKEELFEYVTTLNAETLNVSMLERIHTHGVATKEAVFCNDENDSEDLHALEYPFELAWQKSQSERMQLSNSEETPQSVCDSEDVDDDDGSPEESKNL